MPIGSSGALLTHRVEKCQVCGHPCLQLFNYLPFAARSPETSIKSVEGCAFCMHEQDKLEATYQFLVSLVVEL